MDGPLRTKSKKTTFLPRNRRGQLRRRSKPVVV